MKNKRLLKIYYLSKDFGNYSIIVHLNEIFDDFTRFSFCDAFTVANLIVSQNLHKDLQNVILVNAEYIDVN